MTKRNAPAASQGGIAIHGLNQWLTTAQAGNILHITNWTVRQYVASGKLPASRIGNRLLLAAADIEAYIRSQAVPVKLCTAEQE